MKLPSIIVVEEDKFGPVIIGATMQAIKDDHQLRYLLPKIPNWRTRSATCRICQSTFMQKADKHIYCSHTCREERKKTNEKAWYARWGDKLNHNRYPKTHLPIKRNKKCSICLTSTSVRS